MNWRNCFTALFLAITLLPFFGCSKNTDATASKPDTFIFARGSDAQKLDPADIDDGESVNTIAQILEGLVRFKPGTFEIEPWLASGYEISRDALRYTFQIREGVRFHDGTPLTAETAAFSFQRQLDRDHPAHFPEASFQYWDNLFKEVIDVRPIGPMTLQITLGEPNAALLNSVASFPAWLVSPASFEKNGIDMQRHPVGTGPYRFSAWKPNQAIVLEKNPDYWGNPAGFEQIILRPVPENTVRLLELKAGKIHGLDGLQPAELAELRTDTRFLLHQQPGMNVGYMSFCGFVERLRPPEVRHAIAMAIDRQALVELALDGLGQVAQYPIPPGYLGEPEGPGPIHYDPAQAREILARYPELLAQPIRLHTINAPRPYFPDPAMMASLIRNDLEKVGLKIEIVTKDFKSHLHDTRNGDFELGLLGWSNDNGDTDNFLASFFSSWAANKGTANNISFYVNPEMDGFLLAARAETEPAKRQGIYEKALALWARDLPLVPLVSAVQIVVLRKEVTGFKLSKTGNHFFGPIGWSGSGN